MSTTRRHFIKQGLTGLAGLSLLGLAGCGTDNANATIGASQAEPDSGTLSMLFWGSATRDQLTRATFDQFNKQNPNYKITSQFFTFDVYFNKLDALIASGKAPDLIQMDMRYIAQYVRKRELMDLTEIIYNQTLDLSDFDPLLLSGSKVNNTVYGIPLGGNYQSCFYNADYLEKAGMPLPESWTWDSFMSYTTELTKALGGTAYATQDISIDITSFELFIRQHGHEMYTRDGQVNFTQEEAGDWFNYWSKMRDARACLPYSLQKNLDVSGATQDNSVVQGKAAFMFTLSNLFESSQKAAFAISPQRKLGITTPPTGGAGSSPAMYLKTSQLLSIYANTKYPQTAVKYANFIINDSNAIKTLGIERGIPGSAKGLNLLRPKMTDIQLKVVDYIAKVSASNLTAVKTVLDPPGAAKVQDLLKSVGNEVAAGSRTVSDGAQAFYTGAKKVSAG
jgi:multiple sugar transport system substrate-binding protein